MVPLFLLPSKSKVGPPISMEESEKCLDNLDLDGCATTLGCDLYCVVTTKTYNSFMLFEATSMEANCLFF